MQQTSSTAGQSQKHAIVLFDGVCNLCTATVQFIIKRDPHGYCKFASLQSPIGQQLLAAHGIDPQAIDSFVVLAQSSCWIRSDAALHVARHLTGWWPLLTIFTLIPRPVRDWCYAYIARHRYRWFGQRATCLLSVPGLQDRFLDPGARE